MLHLRKEQEHLVEVCGTQRLHPHNLAIVQLEALETYAVSKRLRLDRELVTDRNVGAVDAMGSRQDGQPGPAAATALRCLTMNREIRVLMISLLRLVA